MIEPDLSFDEEDIKENPYKCSAFPNCDHFCTHCDNDKYNQWEEDNG